MLSHALNFLLLILIFHKIPTTAAAAPPAYTATDFILVNCGASSSVNDTSRRTWSGDDRSRYAPWNAATISSASAASDHMDSSVSHVLYQTVRAFRSPFKYTFPLSPGPKFLRLYFYPAVYSDFDTLQSFFSVTANAFTLLSNFSASLYSKNNSEASFMKEFVINIGENQKLDLTFSPNSNSTAFVNGIEIVSIPDELYFKGDGVRIKFIDQVFYLNSNTALENLYRFNVGGNRVEVQDDSGPTRGMFRAWSPDDHYIFGADFGYTPHMENLQIKYTKETPPYSAPEIVYTTSRVMGNTSRSLDWLFPVDSGFNYLLRFHFCEIQLEVTHPNERVFTISINNQTAEIQADVILWTHSTGVPIYIDYITWAPGDRSQGKQNLWLSLFPNTETLPKYSNALLNGLEIFKLSDSTQSLAAPNPDLVTDSPPPTVLQKQNGKNNGGGSSVVYAVIGSVLGVVAVAAAVSFLIFRRRRRVKDSGTTIGGEKLSWVPLSTESRSTTRTSGSGVSLPVDLCRLFSLDEIRTATGNFDDNFVIGKGGFGNVYKGLIDNAATTVAIKRLNPSSNQGAREFLTEIEMLSKLRHLHLVSLIGYCDEFGEMILVYDYMAHGTLRDHLYNSYNSPLTWKQRLRICLGAAKGLHYLHTGAKHTIIHRDVKSTNILLDEKFVAKMSDFGLSKVGPTDGAQTHVSTVVKGSLGYLDPEYYKRQQLTEKSDVYSFGVVLFEVLCARPPIIPGLAREQVNLAAWGKFCLKKGTLEEIIDSNLDGQIAPESLSKFVETAVGCLREKGIDRPAMNDVVWSLEFAIQLQETAECRGGDAADGGGDSFLALSPSRPLFGVVGPCTTDEEFYSRFSEAFGSKTSGSSMSSGEKLKPGDVFSEIMNPIGR